MGNSLNTISDKDMQKLKDRAATPAGIRRSSRPGLHLLTHVGLPVRSLFGISTGRDAGQCVGTSTMRRPKPQVTRLVGPIGAGHDDEAGQPGDFQEKPPTEALDAGHG